MKHIKWIHSFVVCVVFAVAVSACGGGGSSSGGGGEAAAPPYAGTYRGPFTVTVTRRRARTTLAQQPVSGVTTIIVNTDNSVVVDPNTSGEFPGRFNPETMTMVASLPGSLVFPNCTGRVIMSGKHIQEGDAHSIDGGFRDENFACAGTRLGVGGSFRTNRVNTNTLSRSGRGIVAPLRESLHE